ncbi:unnamed protein product [Brassicogethes aeneus]|uniref:Uncharacterized protein n=1 Tax=Brassicogethes aeneus TaxID=1431903 RepID=A0A9P0FML9_BRAAE|nr:unnamed protein product [Brassicogethes aeneus]
MYTNLYGWHPMTPTLHKILVHGATVIKYAIVPIGQMSEEAAEARNKNFRLYRQNYSRKFSRTLSNRDVLQRLLLTSDKFVSLSKKSRTQKSSQPFLPETLRLLVPDTPENEEIHGTDNDENLI